MPAPTADPFTALGRGNGFPFCPDDLVLDSVASEYRWTTLGGYNDLSTGAPSQAQLDLSLKNAMKLYWSLYGVDAISTLDRGAVELEVNGLDVDTATTGWLPVPLPKYRVCGSDVDLEYETQWQIAFGDINSTSPSSAKIEANIKIARFIKSDVFLGYGLASADGFELRAYGKEVEAELGLYSGILLSVDQDVAFVTVNGIHFVCVAEAKGDSGTNVSTTTTVNASSLTASVSTTYSPPSNPSFTYTASVSLSSLQFYEYS